MVFPVAYIDTKVRSLLLYIPQTLMLTHCTYISSVTNPITLYTSYFSHKLLSSQLKKKVNSFLCTPCSQLGEWRNSSRHSQCCLLTKGSVRLHAPTGLSPGTETPTTIKQENVKTPRTVWALDIQEEIFAFPGTEQQLFGTPATAQSLYRLHSTGCHYCPCMSLQVHCTKTCFEDLCQSLTAHRYIRNSSASIVNGQVLNDENSFSGRGTDFSLRYHVHTNCGPTKRHLCWGSFPGSKQTESETDHLSPCNAKFKKVWMYFSNPSCVFVTMCLKYGINFTYAIMCSPVRYIVQVCCS